jgi:hypothetical protein
MMRNFVEWALESNFDNFLDERLLQSCLAFHEIYMNFWMTRMSPYSLAYLRKEVSGSYQSASGFKRF